MVKGGIGSGFTSSYREPLHEKGVFQYIKLVLIIATLVVGILILLKTNQITGAAVAQQTISIEDFFAKLNAHPELSGLENEQPIGGQLDANSLSTLQQQFPNVYANAKVGDFLLRYSTKLIIYDYNNDAIVNAVNLAAQ